MKKPRAKRIAFLVGVTGIVVSIGMIFFGLSGGRLPVAPKWWPDPTQEEVDRANELRYYPPQEDAVMTLTVDAIKLYHAPVVDSDSDEDLDKGVIHLPETPMPWDEREQKNVYLAGHRVGNPETTGRMFFNLNQLKSGDSVVLKDTSGNTYEYEVSEVFVVTPDADWVVDPLRGRDMVTLQTCTYPIDQNRIVVRADRA